jgi:hypothetical protein
MTLFAAVEGGGMLRYCALALVLAGLASANALAQSAAPSSTPVPPASAASPASVASPAPGALTMKDLTPAQQAAVQAAIIKTSQNPVGNIAIIPFQNNLNYGVGPYARFQYILNAQPVVPIMLGPKMNLIARTIIPTISQPSFALAPACGTPSGCPSTFGLGDIQEQLFFAPKTQPGALIWGAGPQFQIPSASPGVLGAGKWGAGPALVGLIMPGHIVAGVLLTQLWSFAGQANRPNISAALFQPFFNYNLKDGWAISTSPNITANWTAAPTNRWAVPLGGGVARTFKAGGQLMSLAASYYTYVGRPVGTPQTNVKLVWSLLFPISRGIDVQQLIKEAM